MHALLVTRADALEGCTEGSPEVAELAALTDAIEIRRYPLAQRNGASGKA